MVRRRMIPSAVAALVLVGLSVPLASPATAAGPLPLLTAAGCGASMSSVTSCPANVLMLAQSGLLSMPAAGGGTVGAVAAPALTNTAGSAIGGAVGLLASVAGAFGLSQLFNSPSGEVVAGSVLRTDGSPAQRIKVLTDILGATSTRDYSPYIGSKSGAGTIWAIAPHPSTGISHICVSSTTHYAWPYVMYGTYSDGSSGSNSWDNSGSQCPAAPAGTQKVNWLPAHTAAGAYLTGWRLHGSQSTVSLPAPKTNPSVSVGSMKKQLWCKNPDGGPLVDYITAQAMSLSPGQTVDLQNMTCPVAGQVAVDTSIQWVPTDTTKPTTTIVPPTNWAPENSTPALDAALARPDCAAGSCYLELSKTNGESCGNIGEGCPDWARDPNYLTRYQCKFGGVVVALDACSAYRDPRSGVQPNTKPDGSPYRPTDPVVSPAGQTVTTTTGTAPAPVVAPGAKDDPNGCREASWVDTLNPFNMFNTISCAMQAVFVPDPVAVETSVQGVRDSWANTPMVQASGMVNSITSSLPAGSGCAGISFTFPAVLGIAAQNLSVLNACSEPVAGIAAVTRTIGSISMVILGIMALTRMAGGVIALPGLGKTGGDS